MFGSVLLFSSGPDSTPGLGPGPGLGSSLARVRFHVLVGVGNWFEFK